MKADLVSTSYSEPVSLPELRKHLRIEHNEEDSYLIRLISSARAAAENHIDGIIADRQFRVTIDYFPSEIALPLSPVDPGSVVITYIDTSGNSQTFADFDYTADFRSIKLRPDYNVEWPRTEAGYKKVTITFSAGFLGFFGEMSEEVKQAILMIASTKYDQGEDHSAGVKLHTVPMSSELLLTPYKKVAI